ncbi:MAG: dTMP kinase [Candidatus Micrarchaeaceae archaeon]
MFIAIDGIDGSGKTTQSKMLVERLNSEGLTARLTREPTDGIVGLTIRNMLSLNAERPSPLALQLLFTADRAEHIASIRATIESTAAILVTDRYYFSTVAYGAASGIDANYLKLVNGIFPKPDMTIILEARVAEVMERVNRRGSKEIFEFTGFLEKVQAAYRKEFSDAVFIDASKPIGEVHEEIYARVKQLLRKQ